LEKCGVKNCVYVPNKTDVPDIAPYEIYSFHRKFNVLERIMYYYKQKHIYGDILKKIELGDIKLIHAHKLFSTGYVAYKIYKKMGIPYIVAVRNTDVNIFFKYMPYLRKTGLKILENSFRIIFISSAYEKLVLSKYIPYKLKDFINEKSLTVPNGIDRIFLDNIHYKKQENKYNNINIVYIGDINKNKNIITTIKACKELQSMGYNILYTIIGKNEDKKLFEKIITNNQFIVYFPPCSKEQLVKKMRDCDIFIMPSITETFGCVYPEAMSQGLPIIYSKGQGFDGYFEDGEVGFAVDCFDYVEIANKVVEILNNYENISIRCSQNAYRFDWEKIALEYKKIYNKVKNIQ
jgi:glycosyltransferase involved in cell wall biosynthesis